MVSVLIIYATALQCNLMLMPRPNCDLYKRTFAYCGAIYWNSLPDKMKDIYDLNSFKKALKVYILM